MGMFGSNLPQPDANGWMLNIATGQAPQPQFGQPQSAMQMATQAPMGVMPGDQPSLPRDPRIDKAMHPGFFGKGGNGWKWLGIIGDGLQVAGGGQPTYQLAQQRWQEMEAEREQRQQEFEARRAERDAARNEPQAINLGNGGFGVWTPDGGLQVEREPQRDVPDWQQYVTVMSDPSLSAEQKRLYQDGYFRGAGPTAMEYRKDFKQTPPGKAPSAGGGSNRSAPRPPAGFILD